MQIETWIHTAEGVFKPDNPYETVGTKFEVIAQDPNSWASHRFVGQIAEINEDCVRRNQSRRAATRSGKTLSAHIQLPQRFNDQTGRATYGGHRRLPKKCLKLVE